MNQYPTLKLFLSLLCLAPIVTAEAQEPAEAADEPDSQLVLPGSDTTQTTEAAQDAPGEQADASEEPAPTASVELPYIGASSADESLTGDGEVYELTEFTVSTADDRGYYSANTTSATRTNALVKNTPITVSVINEQLIEDLNILNDQDLVRANASISQDPDGFSLNQLRIRGFRSLTQRYDLFWREITRDSYNIQRVDVIKGANSLMYGQADPGGLINSVPKIAQHGNNFTNLRGAIGNRGFRRAEIDVNHTVNDKLAVRVMGVDFSRELDQLYETVDLGGATIETSYRLSPRTQLRGRVEVVNLNQNLAPNMFNSTSGDSRFAPNSPQDDGLSGRPSFSLGTYRNEFIYSPDAVEFIPQEIVDDLILDPGYAAQIGLADPTAVTRGVLDQIYGAWDSQDDRYSVTGPDKFNKRSGLITTLEWTQRFTDNLQARVAINREDNDRSSLARDGYTAGRVNSDDSGPRAYEPYVETYWRKQDGRTLYHALKSTLLWDVELDNSIPVIRDSEHKLLFGLDYDHLERNPKQWEQVQDPNNLKDGQFYSRNDLFNERFYLSDGFGPDAPNIGYNGQDDLFVLRQDNNLNVETQSAWFAAQSSYLNGRLRTLVGLRYDYIDIDHTILDYKYGVGDRFVNNNLGGDFSRAVTRIEDQNNTYDQVSPTIGGLFWITDSVGVFANYAESIQSPTNIDVDPLGNIIPPVYGEGYEYGIRFDLFDQKLNGQINAFYIEKINDNIVNYDFRLGDIYTFEEFGAEYPQLFNPNGSLNNNLLPGKNVAGDVSRSEGLEVEFYYNPNDNLSFIFSYTYNNLDALEINEKVNPRFGQVFGQAPHNALLIGRYQFRDGPLKGLTVGANQRFRSSSTIGEWYIEDDDDPPGGGQWYDIEFDPELVTDVFFNYQTRIGSGPGSARLNLAFQVRNLWDTTELIQRNKSAFHRQSRQYILQANLRF